MNKEEFRNLIKSMLDDGNTVEFAINDPDNEGVVVNEWSQVKDGETLIPSKWLTSQSVVIDEEVAWEIVRELGLIYPVIVDESTGSQTQ